MIKQEAYNDEVLKNTTEENKKISYDCLKRMITSAVASSTISGSALYVASVALPISLPIIAAVTIADYLLTKECEKIPMYYRWFIKTDEEYRELARKKHYFPEKKSP